MPSRYRKAREGKKTAMICRWGAGIYGMASLMYEIGAGYPDCELEVVPGITAASSGAAVLGAPLNHDFCVISLSDLLTPWEVIEKRLLAAAMGDFVIAIYNPSSKLRADYLARACDILAEHIEGGARLRLCGKYRQGGRARRNLHIRGTARAVSQYVYDGFYRQFPVEDYGQPPGHTERI